MASNASLEASTQDRKARLAQLRSLKQKQHQSSPSSSQQRSPQPTPADDDGGGAASRLPRHQQQPSSLKRKQSPGSSEYPAEDEPPNAGTTTTYLSGRNYDPVTRGAKLGFDAAPDAGQDTIERRAAALALETRQAAEREEKEDKPLDLFKLQPKKPNWDLKRDLDRKLERLNVATDNAIARLVRERIERQQQEAKSKAKERGKGGGGGGGGVDDSEEEVDEGGEEAGMEGAELVEALREREKEGREDGLGDVDEEEDGEA